MPTWVPFDRLESKNPEEFCNFPRIVDMTGNERAEFGGVVMSQFTQEESTVNLIWGQLFSIWLDWNHCQVSSYSGSSSWVRYGASWRGLYFLLSGTLIKVATTNRTFLPVGKTHDYWEKRFIDNNYASLSKCPRDSSVFLALNWNFGCLPFVINTLTFENLHSGVCDSTICHGGNLPSVPFSPQKLCFC